MGHKGSEDVWGDKMKDYREQFTILCENLNKGFTKEDVRKHNRSMKKLSHLYHEVEKEKDKSIYLDLLKHENESVRITAAAHCLGFGVYIPIAKMVLNEIAKKSTNSVEAFNAQAILDVYNEQGYLLF